MERLFMIAGRSFLYWNSLLLVLAAAAAICAFSALFLLWDGDSRALAVFVPLSLGLSLVLSRLIHWYCLPNQYAGLSAALLDLSAGGYALMGVFAACLLAAVLLRLTGLVKDLPRFLDCLCVAGCGGIALGRLSFFYSSLDRGSVVKSVNRPFVYPILNAVSGQPEYRLATFQIQALVLGVLFLVLLCLLLRERRCRRLPAGDIAMVFALVYGAAAVVLDSTRYDSLYLRSNGFVSVVQILGAVAVVACAVYYSVRAVRTTGMKKSFPFVWLLAFFMVGGGGFMEYYVQRHGREAAFSYTVMSVCLTACVCLILLLRRWSLATPGTQDGEEYGTEEEF